MVEELRRTLKEVAEEKSADKWIPVIGGLLFPITIVVSLLDLPARNWTYNLPVGITGVAMLTAGLTLYAASRKFLGRFYSEAVKIVPDHRLITDGPYRMIQHPMYLSEIVFGLSIPMIFDSLLGLFIMLVPIPLILLRIRFEEGVLVSRFGQEYLEYSRRTKKLIPYIY